MSTQSKKLLDQWIFPVLGLMIFMVIAALISAMFVTHAHGLVEDDWIRVMIVFSMTMSCAAILIGLYLLNICTADTLDPELLWVDTYYRETKPSALV